MQKSLLHFLVAEILIVGLISVSVAKQVNHGTAVKYIFHNQKYCIFSWCTKLNVKDTKMKLKSGKHRNNAHKTNLLLLRLAFNENDSSITHISM
jgi:hypothetical protein